MKQQKFGERFATIYGTAVKLAKVTDAEALVVLLDGPTDWEQLKKRAGKEKIVVVPSLTPDGVGWDAIKEESVRVLRELSAIAAPCRNAGSGNNGEICDPAIHMSCFPNLVEQLVGGDK